MLLGLGFLNKFFLYGITHLLMCLVTDFIKNYLMCISKKLIVIL